MNRSLSLSLAAVALAAMASASLAQTVTLSLDLYYTDPSNPNSKGSWELRANGSSEGIAGLDTQVAGILAATGLSSGVAQSYFVAPAGFQETFDNGTKPWNTDQDGNAATLDALFGQVPVAAPGPQTLTYGAGVTGGSPDRLGGVVGGSSLGANSVLLAHGWFGAGSAPSLPAGQTAANVFTAQGTASDPPAVGTIVAATVTTQVRSNATGKAGDANLDNDVDAFQFPDQGDAQILSSNLTKTGKGVLWTSGDFNADGDVDAFQFPDQGDAQILASKLGSDAADGSVEATYDARTGALTFDVGQGVAVIGLNTAGKILPSADAARLGSASPVQVNTDDLAYFDANGLPKGVWDQGIVLPAGLGASDLNFAYTPVGAPTVVAPVRIIDVPEPAAFALLALGSVALVARRRVA